MIFSLWIGFHICICNVFRLVKQVVQPVGAKGIQALSLSIGFQLRRESLGPSSLLRIFSGLPDLLDILRPYVVAAESRDSSN